MRSGRGHDGGWIDLSPPAHVKAAVAQVTAPSRAGTPPFPVEPGPTGGPVPAGFQAQSATFVSVDDGWVLGTAPCTTAPCTSIVRTTDGGASWKGNPAPTDVLASDEGSGDSKTGVTAIRFADASDGWVYGPDAWSTHDGGATWTKIGVGVPGDQVVDLEAAAGEVDAVVTDCSATSSSPCTGQLWHAAVGSDTFTQVRGVTVGQPGPTSLSLHGTTGYVTSPSQTDNDNVSDAAWVTTDGTTWASHPATCPDQMALTSIAATSASQAFGLCAGEGAAGSAAKQVVETTNAGGSWLPWGSPAPRGGDPESIAASGPGNVFINAASGATQLYRTSDGGTTWTTPITLDDGGAGFTDVGMSTATHGFAVHEPAAHLALSSDPSGEGPDPATLFVTTDGGATWTPAHI